MCLQEECIFLTYKHQCLQERHTNLSSRKSYILLPYKNTKIYAFPVKMYAFPKDTFYRTASGLLPGVNHVAHRSFSHYLGSLVPWSLESGISGWCHRHHNHHHIVLSPIFAIIFRGPRWTSDMNENIEEVTGVCEDSKCPKSPNHGLWLWSGDDLPTLAHKHAYAYAYGGPTWWCKLA